MTTDQKAADRAKRVLIVDDQPAARRGAAQVIEAEADLTVCGEAADGAEALAVMAATDPDVAVVDICLGHGGGTALIRSLRNDRPDLPILVHSNHDESLYAERTLQAGARGYVAKTEPVARLVEAIRAVGAGKVYLSEKVTARLLAAIADGGRDAAGLGTDVLTAREFEVFELIGQLLEPRQIARQLHVSIKTVESHREHIKAKLKLASAGELRQYAVGWARMDGRI